ncbi:MAG: helix-turn-helix domain-containing protein [Clostridia bacterium]|nr:helix-turn-helix domain-containing protein [Clostridia bacterium]
MENHSIGKLIARLRNEKGLTQAELARKLNVTDKAVSKWENEDGEPSISLLPAIAEEFGITLDYLMRGIAPSDDSRMSKLEKCAKNNDVELFDSLPINYLESADEYGKTLEDYIVKYKAVKIANAYAKRGCKSIKIALVGDSLEHLELWEKPNKNSKFRAHSTDNDRKLREYSNETVKAFIISNYNKLNSNSLRMYFAQFRHTIKDFMKKAIELKDEGLISLLVEIRNKYIPGEFCVYPDNRIVYEKNEMPSFSEFGEKLLDLGFIDSALACKPNIDPAKVEIARLKKTGKGDSDKIEILKMVENGCLDYAKLLETKNLSLIEKGFKEYPSWIDIGDVEKSSKGYWFSNSIIRYGKQEKTYIQIKMFCGKILRLGKLYDRPLYDDGLKQIHLDVDVQSAEEAVERINKDLARLNIILARAATKELGFSRELRMKYICDYYNRFLFEECVELAYKKLKEFFEIACELSGTVEEMLESFFSSISVSSFKYAFSKEKLSLIVKAYQKLEKGTFDEDKDMFSSDVISHLGKIFDESINLFCKKYNYS